MFMFRLLYNYIIETYNVGNNKEMQKEVKKSLLILFLDEPNAILSLHSICREGEATKSGQIGKFWKQNLTIKCINAIVNSHPTM